MMILILIVILLLQFIKDAISASLCCGCLLCFSMM